MTGVQPVGEKVVAVFVEQVREDNDVGGDAGVTQGHTFLNRRHGQTSKSRVADQRARDLYGAMPVGIRFDDGHDPAARMQEVL